MAVPERLALLRRLRSDLAENLTAVGVTALETETLETLVPKVLRALEGTGEGFTAALKGAWDVSYGYFSTGETVSFAGMATVTKAVRITALVLTVTGEGVPALSAAGSGWTVGKSGNTLTARYRPGGVIPAAAISAALERFSLSGDGATPVTASAALSGLGASGAAYSAAGTAAFSYAYGMTWRLMALVFPAWTDLEGQTWRAVENFSKP